MGIFNFKNKKGEVLNHWIAFADNFNFPSQEFYASVEKGLVDRQVPGLDISRTEFAEGGLLSAKRIYLRLLRERLAFDVCAAPFGTGYFFSCRCVEISAEVRLWHVLVILAALGGLFLLLVKLLGFILAGVASVALLLAVAQVFRNTIALGLSDLDRVLLRTPALGPVYERFFRKETYYRLDTRLLYLDLVPGLVKKLSEEVTQSKGVQLTRQYQLAPILGELYKPVPPGVKL